MQSKRSGDVHGSGEHNADGEGIRDEFDISLLNPRLRARFERLSEKERRMSREQKDALVKLLPEGQVIFDEPLSKHSSIGIGGPAESFVVVEDETELKKVLEWSIEQEIDYCFWGGGSNVLVKDKGLRGVTVKLGKGFDKISVERSSGDEFFVSVGAATSTAKLVRWASDEGYSGLEFLSGVWGTVGGNLITNAGTKDGSIGDAVEEMTIIDRERRELTIKRSALKFEYRRLKMPSTAAIARVLMKLKKSTSEEVSAKVEEILKKRNGSQPVGSRSLGCIFKNPEKISAGMLIDEAGLKSVRVGGARVSNVHANFIVNEGNASAKDVLVLIGLIKERVKEESGVVLDLEIEVLGDE